MPARASDIRSRIRPSPQALASAWAVGRLAAGWALALAAVAAEPEAVSVLAELRAADAARADLARETNAWRVDQERDRALLAGVSAQAARLRADAAAAREAAARHEREAEAAGESRRRLEALEVVFTAQAEAIVAALARARDASVPGAVPPVDAASEPRQRFAAALRALEAAERAAAVISVGIAEGELAGARRAVTVLRVGGLGWWSAIEGDAAGVVVPRSGALPQLIPSDAAGADAVRRAIAIARGARAPELLLLPLPPAPAANATTSAPVHGSKP